MRAVQYLRMSTDHQRYSIPDQLAAITSYALENRLDVIGSYIDAGKSGLTFTGRSELQRLLADVMSPDRQFETVLVLDVSRWGRFQDPDQAAHYEFICRQAGVAIVYCSEPFFDADPTANQIMKSLKRIMAAEYSRELSAKISASKHDAAGEGFWHGGPVSYGIRREIIDSSGTACGILEDGSQRLLKGFRTRVRRGPEAEIRVLKRIFLLFARSGWSPQRIADQLNSEGVQYKTRRFWMQATVRNMLRNEIYIGVYVTNRSSQRFTTDRRPNPPEQWRRITVMEPIIPLGLFRAAARGLAGPPRFTCRDDLINDLRRIHEKHGFVSRKLIETTPRLFRGAVYRKFFGTIKSACAAAGVPHVPSGYARRTTDDVLLERLRTLAVREGRLTINLINAEPNLPSASTIAVYFGGIMKVYAALGLPSSQSEISKACALRR